MGRTIGITFFDPRLRSVFFAPPQLAFRNNRRPRIAVLTLLALLSIAQPVSAQDQAKRLVALLDYLGSDYKNAVQDGKIVSEDEFQEMQEFAKRSRELLDALKASDRADRAGIEPIVKALENHIDNKADPKRVSELAASAKEKLLTTYKIVPYPKQLPSLADGKQIFRENCAQCHGENGK